LLRRPGSDNREVLDVDLDDAWEVTEDRFVFNDGVLEEAEGAEEDEEEDGLGARILLIAAGRYVAADPTGWPGEL
jgi:hypothetical protein